MPGIAKNSPRTSPQLGYVAKATVQQADADAELRAKQAKAKAVRTQRLQQQEALDCERQRVHDEANRDNGHGWMLPWHELRHAGNMAWLDNGMRHELLARLG